MLDTDLKNILMMNLVEYFQKIKINIVNYSKDLGFGMINHDFVEFWSTYSDEIYGKIGYLVDLAMDLVGFFKYANKNFEKKYLAYLIIIFPVE